MKKTYLIAALLLTASGIYADIKKKSYHKDICPQQNEFSLSMIKEHKPMKIYDISWPLTNDMTTYKDKGTFKREETRTWDKDKSRESLITTGSHIGTHIDAPTHFLEKGKTIDQLDLSKLVGPCKVIDLTSVAVITAEDLKNHELAPRVLFKTRNSKHAATEKFDKDFVYVDKTAARYLAEHNVQCVGIDYLGIETKQPNHETHEQLLGKEVVIIEGLRLAEVPAGNYFLMCLPIPLVGSDAAPARAILIKE